jgi:hypothetical protein
VGIPPPEDINGPTPAKLKDLVLKLLEKGGGTGENGCGPARREPGRPNIIASRAAWSRRPIRSRLGVHARSVAGVGAHARSCRDEERKVWLTAQRPGSRFKGYTGFVVQDLALGPHIIDFQCERWRAPDSKVHD